MEIERKKDDGFKEEQKMAGEIYLPNDGDREKNIKELRERAEDDRRDLSFE